MNAISGLRFLRPYLCKDLRIKSESAYLRFSTSTRCCLDLPSSRPSRTPYRATETELQYGESDVKLRRAVALRTQDLKEAGALVYPRIQPHSWALTFREFQSKYGHLAPGIRSGDIVILRGRVHTYRASGTRLLFIEIFEDGVCHQVICNYKNVSAIGGVTFADFKKFSRTVRRGDIISAMGSPICTKRKDNSRQLSIDVSELPDVLTPALALLPVNLENPETRIRHRHVDLLIHHKVSDILRLRSHIIQYIRNFLIKDDFLEFQTPIIADKASGAIARPFTTVATEFSEKQLALRIAPELWLKRLIMGGMGRVFEIGPVFRNEGLDATHNAEFTTCEFYKSFADLTELISMTEQMMSGLAELTARVQEERLGGLRKLDVTLFKTPFKRIEFIPAIQAALGESLPDLAKDDATENLLSLFSKFSITPPQSPTLPRLLDKLSSIFLEPDCQEPTFIMHHPACMAPLAKSFLDHKTNQVVSARVELFVRKQEIANMYEEENSPFEQRAKFEQQLQWRDDENRATVDENYLQALENGLPPTGGWGCGIDRLIMLFSGASRINDVLPFGNLRNVVNLGVETPRKAEKAEAETTSEIQDQSEQSGLSGNKQKAERESV